jgi:Fe2+ or Zn2+ uptake regulation protein
MLEYTKALETLRAMGLRLTPQRMLILSIVASGNSHMDVDQVFQRAKESYPYIDITTVYRTLQLFKKLGVVSEVAIGNRLHFEVANPESPHQHMVCLVCSEAYDLPPQYLEEFRHSLVQELAFEPDLKNFTVTGVCSQCARDKSNSETGGF